MTVVKDSKGSLGMQITEGSDGNVYVQSVIPGGPAYNSACVNSGDQIIAVDGRNLLRLKYEDALNALKDTGPTVNFVLSQNHLAKNLSTCPKSKSISSSGLQRTMNKLKQISRPHPTHHDRKSERSTSTLEKHITENCYDVSNLRKYNSIFPAANNNNNESNSPEVPYHKHIRYEIETETDSNNSSEENNSPRRVGFRVGLNRTLSKSCTQIYAKDDNDRAVIVDMIPKSQAKMGSFHSLDRKSTWLGGKEVGINSEERSKVAGNTSIALPRSLGLSRRWRGPVRYPVTPVKKTSNFNDSNSIYVTTSDEEQVFI